VDLSLHRIHKVFDYLPTKVFHRGKLQVDEGLCRNSRIERASSGVAYSDRAVMASSFFFI
jgi:hypothetical protein